MNNTDNIEEIHKMIIASKAERQVGGYYYRKAFGDLAQKLADKCISGNGEILHVPCGSSSLSTLYTKFIMGKSYLIDQMDKSYEDKFKNILVRRCNTKGFKGLTLQYVEKAHTDDIVNNAKFLKDIPVSKEVDKAKEEALKKEVREFIQGSDIGMKEWIDVDVPLSLHDEIIVACEQAENLAYKLQQNYIRIVRTTK